MKPIVRIAFSFCVVLASCLSCNLLLAQTQRAPTTVVVGADDPLIDVPAVQSAVDQGGTVLLRGTFDFGTDSGNHIIVPGRPYPDQDRKGESTVFIYRNDVTILGETGEEGELLTVVKNGMPAFWIGWDGEVSRSQPPGTYGVDFGIETFPVDEQGRVDYRDSDPGPTYGGPQTRYARAFQNVSATIKTIRFDSPLHYGIKATAGRDVVLIGNVFLNVRFGGLVHLNNFAGATHIAAGFIGVGMFYAPFVFPAITGKIVAERNIVDDVGTELIDTHWGESYGLGALGTNAAVTIQQNQIRNVGRQANGTRSDAWAASILLADNYAASPLVTGNTVYNTSGVGIWDVTAIAPAPGATIEKNTLADCAVAGIQTDSFVRPRAVVFINDNSISQDGLLPSGQSGITANNLTGSLIRSNTFAGDFTAALVVLTNSSNCTLFMNKDRRKAIPPGSPTYYLDATSSGNLIKAASGTAIDDGTNNTIFLPNQGGK